MARSVWDEKNSSNSGDSTPYTGSETDKVDLDEATTEREKLLDQKMQKLASGGIGKWAFLVFFIVLGGLGWTIAGTNYDRSNISPYQLAKGQDLKDKLDMDADAQASRKLVDFEAHIMSKCPDAQVCLREMVLPAMQRVLPKVNFTLSYIGTPTSEDGVECKHGASECMGNILELCAANLYPDPKIYLGFTMCLTKDYEKIPARDLVEDCALEHGIDFEKLNICSSTDDGSVGMKMLRDSVMRSKDANVTKSCTVRVDNKVYCIRDGGQWTDCSSGPGVNDLVIAIEKLYYSS